MSLLELFSSTLNADPNIRKLAELRLREVNAPPPRKPSVSTTILTTPSFRLNENLDSSSMPSK